MPGPATHTTPSDPVRIELELSGESIDLQTVSTVATRLIDLLGDLERGIVHCRGDGTPFSMTKISSIFVRQRPKRTMSELLGAARGLTGGMSSEDYVNSARDGKHG